MSAPDSMEIERVVEAARDALTDEMVGRLTGAVGGGLTLIDQIDRAGLGKAIPAIAEMVNNGDLERLVHLARVYGSAQDALTDEMVGRLTEAVGGGLTLIDQVNRAGLEKAIPAIAEMVNNGDLERLVHLARVYGSAQDALTDEMVGRLAETLGEGLSLLDRFSRGGALRLVEMLERLESSGALERTAKVVPLLVERLGMLEDMLHCVEEAAKEQVAPSPGGFGGLWSLMKDPDNQESLRFLISVGKRLRTKCAS
ncbi:MAG TPA: DUF1641 domain-containing protein [Burkholderiales bacterium]|nr:DUF1641 domain-containing protein [Burkholderiales bacterium]